MTVITSPAVTTTTGELRPVTGIVEWGPVIAGAILAASLSFVFLTFGSAVGFSMTSAWPDSGASAKWTVTLAAFWVLAQQIGAFLAGGYLVGRLRKPPEPRTVETEFRDGVHGSLVWAVGIAIGIILAASAANVAARVSADAGRVAFSTASQNSSPVAYFADALLRPSVVAPAPGQLASTAVRQPPGEEARAEIGRILARAAVVRELGQPDRSYLAWIVSQRTGLGTDEAQRRVNDTFAQFEQSVRKAADNTRRVAALGGFLTAASIVIGFAAAWWGAVRGGHHRDNNFTHRGLHLRSRQTEESMP